MFEQAAADIILVSGGAVTAILTLMVFLRKAWGAISTENLNTVRNSAESALYRNLRDDIDRVRTEMIQMRTNYENEFAILKKAHVDERQELVSRIQYLEEALETIVYTNSVIKDDATAILHDLQLNPAPENEALIELLERIIRDSDVRIKKSRIV